MLKEFFASQEFQEALRIIQSEFLTAIWETFYVTVLSTFIAVVIGLHLWKRQMFLSIAGGTILYMVLIQFVFV